MNTEASSHPETCCICSFILVSFLHPSLHLVFFIIKSLFFERKNEGEQRTVLGEEAVGHIYMLKAVLCVSRWVMSESLWPCGLQPARLLCPWGSSRQEYWGGLACPPPGDLPHPGLPHCRRILYPLSHQGKPRNTGVGSLSLLQGIFYTQESNPGLPHCRWILYPLRHQGKPRNTGVGCHILLQGIFLTQESNRGLLHFRQVLYQLSYQGGWKRLISGLW